MEEKKCPPVPQELIEYLKELFDIRKLVYNSMERAELLGIQSVIDYLDFQYRDQNKLDEVEDK